MIVDRGAPQRIHGALSPTSEMRQGSLIQRMEEILQVDSSSAIMFKGQMSAPTHPPQSQCCDASGWATAIGMQPWV